VLAFVEITLIWHEKYTILTKRHYRDNMEYRDILTHDNRHQLFLISPIPIWKAILPEVNKVKKG